MSIKYVASSKLPTKYGIFNIHGFLSEQDNIEHLAFTMGNISDDKPLLTRIHSECLTGDALFSLRCDCGAQLQSSMECISKEGQGLLLYLRQEGRGIGLINKIKAYHLQDCGADTVEANELLGFSPDHRDYSMCVAMLKYLKIKKIRLMTNNPIKVRALSEQGIEIVERISLITKSNAYNAKYLETKMEKMGHLMAADQQKGKKRYLAVM